MYIYFDIKKYNYIDFHKNSNIYLDVNFFIIPSFIQCYATLLVTCGTDYTMEFAWIRNDEKRVAMIENNRTIASRFPTVQQNN